MSSNLSRLGQAAMGNTELATRFSMLGKSWDPKTRPDGFVNLGVAENLLMRDELVEYLQRNLKVTPAALSYGEGGIGSLNLRKAAARFMTQHLKPVKPIQHKSVVITNGCSSSIEQCSFLLADPGEVFLLGRPFYTTFVDDVEFRTQRKIAYVPFGEIDPCSIEAVVCYEKVLQDLKKDGIQAKGIIICNPHNPLGRCYSKDALIGLMKLCNEYRLHLISDEIYALSVWENDLTGFGKATKFTSASAVETSGIIDSHLVHVLWGISKDLGANGLRLGMIVSQGNPDFINALEVVSLYSYPSRLADIAVAGLLNDTTFTDAFIAENRKRLARNYKLAIRFLIAHDIEFSSGTNAGFFLWLNLGRTYMKQHPDVSPSQLSQAIASVLWQSKVYCNNGDTFGSEKPGWVRCIIAVPDTYLLEGLHRIVRALKYE